MQRNARTAKRSDSDKRLFHQTEDGQTRIDVRMAEEPDWLPQRLMAELFQSIYEEGELQPKATVKKYLTLPTEGNRKVSQIIDYGSRRDRWLVLPDAVEAGITAVIQAAVD